MYTELNVKLTHIDRAILDSCKTVCDGLSAYIGDGFELVMHSLEDTQHSVVKILNGFHSGRSIGSSLSSEELDMLEHLRNDRTANYICYLSDSKKSGPIKCNAIAVPGENGRIVGMLCLYFYLNTPLIQVLNHFLPCLDSQNRLDCDMLQSSYAGTEDLVSDTVNEVSAQVLSDPSISAVNKNKEIIRRLSAKGVFRMKEAVQRCADILGISKNTVYMHLRNINAQE